MNTGKRRSESRDGRTANARAFRLLRLYLCSSVFIGCSILLAGCTSEETHSSMQAEQDRALADPYNYGPGAADVSQPAIGGDDIDRTNISGGGTQNLDKRALKRDLDSVFNP